MSVTRTCVRAFVRACVRACMVRSMGSGYGFVIPGGFGNGLLLTGDQKYVEVWRHCLDTIASHKKLGGPDGTTVLYPHMCRLCVKYVSVYTTLFAQIRIEMTRFTI